MPVLNLTLDPNGHALVDLVLFPAQPRRHALQALGQNLPPHAVTGMLDTGAAVTVIDPQVRQALNLTPFRVRLASVPNAPNPIRVASYKVDLAILGPGGVLWPLSPMLSVVEMPLIHTGTAVLVGCDVLERCYFGYNGSAHTFFLAF